ncbi:MAG: hypothetical protein JWN63_1801 [Candidatus Acidoferrum typicum]|nr:hypothetical protein [Candidatus Acidoferrum typicum]
MRPRDAVLLTPSESYHSTQLLSRRHFVRVSQLDATYRKQRGGAPRFDVPTPIRAIEAPPQFWSGDPDPVGTLFSAKAPRALRLSAIFIPAPLSGLLVRRPPDLATFRRADVSIPPATLFPPWHANASANTSSPISIGAKRSRAPFAFRRIPPCHSRGTINIAGSKLVRGTVR